LPIVVFPDPLTPITTTIIPAPCNSPGNRENALMSSPARPAFR
jgi:hypothetical protein